MYNFELYNPTKIVFGANGRKNIGKMAARFGKHVLLVYGGNGIKERGVFGEVAGLLEEEGLIVTELGGVQANPRSTMVTEGGSICRSKHIELIIALGGGSVIDCSKAISLAAYYEGDYWDIVDGKIPAERALPLFVVSTIAGTGTEMNNSCVITNEEKKIKRGYNSEFIRPIVSFIDPVLTFSVNKFQTACGVADTISHVLDTAYMVNGDKMQMLEGVMESICKTVIHYGPIAVREPCNYEARANLLWAATWGLNGFLKNGIRQLAACHAIEHEISARYDITHGLGMAIIMPRYYEYVLNEKNANTYEQFAKRVFCVEPTLPRMEAAKEMIIKLKKFLFCDLQLPSGLSEIGVPDDQFEIMANNICWGSTLPGLADLTEKDVLRILKNAL